MSSHRIAAARSGELLRESYLIAAARYGELLSESDYLIAAARHGESHAHHSDAHQDRRPARPPQGLLVALTIAMLTMADLRGRRKACS